MNLSSFEAFDNLNTEIIILDGDNLDLLWMNEAAKAAHWTDDSSKLGGKKISSLLNMSNLNKFKKRLDPRLYNGAILLGLNSPVVKSHGGTDYIGFANAISVCEKIVKGKLIDKIKENIN